MKTTIDGWAFKANEDELKNSCFSRYEEIKHLRKAAIQDKSIRYGEQVFTGTVPDGLTPKDIALLCDEGSTCYGGWVDIVGKNFRCGIWND